MSLVFLACAGYAQHVNDPHDIQVVLRNPAGQYLSADLHGPVLTGDRANAKVFHYIKDQVRERIGLMRTEQGTAWVAVPVEPRQAFETCDRCGRKVMAFKALYDGARFLCSECAVAEQDAKG